jgi:hypothetical protein
MKWRMGRTNRDRRHGVLAFVLARGVHVIFPCSVVHVNVRVDRILQRIELRGLNFGGGGVAASISSHWSNLTGSGLGLSFDH